MPIANGQRAIVSIHASRGGRPPKIRIVLPHRLVSIHALARRATFCGVQYRFQGLFQFTPSRGGRPCLPQYRKNRPRFQFTPSRGGRRVNIFSIRYRESFNSRPRAEGDVSRSDQLSVRAGFNSRPRAEGDFSIGRCRRGSMVSIHALARRATFSHRLRARY